MNGNSLRKHEVKHFKDRHSFLYACPSHYQGAFVEIVRHQHSEPRSSSEAIVELRDHHCLNVGVNDVKTYGNERVRKMLPWPHES